MVNVGSLCGGKPLCSKLEGDGQKGRNDAPEILHVFMLALFECVGAGGGGGKSGHRLI